MTSNSIVVQFGNNDIVLFIYLFILFLIFFCQKALAKSTKTDRTDSLLSMAEKISLENIFSGMEELRLHQKQIEMS